MRSSCNCGIIIVWSKLWSIVSVGRLHRPGLGWRMQWRSWHTTCTSVLKHFHMQTAYVLQCTRTRCKSNRMDRPCSWTAYISTTVAQSQGVAQESGVDSQERRCLTVESLLIHKRLVWAAQESSMRMLLSPAVFLGSCYSKAHTPEDPATPAPTSER